VSDRLLRHIQEISAAPSRDEARRVFEAIEASHSLSEGDFETLCVSYANILFEWDHT
jgi:hypothetical protein